MSSQHFQFQDRVKVITGNHKGRVGQVAQTTPEGFLFGVRFSPKELHFMPGTHLMKLKTLS